LQIYRACAAEDPSRVMPASLPGLCFDLTFTAAHIIIIFFFFFNCRPAFVAPDSASSA
jgi:hypothetical protein